MQDFLPRYGRESSTSRAYFSIFYETKAEMSRSMKNWGYTYAANRGSTAGGQQRTKADVFQLRLY